MKIFPVVHIINSDVHVATRESNRAFELGADGVYLIDHYNGDRDKKPLLTTYYDTLAESPDRYVGINILGLGPLGAMRALARSLNKSKGLLLPQSALWVDDMREDGLGKSDAIELRNSNPMLQHIRLLGGVAFKYTDTFTEDPVLAAYETEWLKDSVDAIVTSGVATGREPTVEKILAMKEAAGEKPIVVASGITAENISKYEGIVDEVLVSSSIETFPGSGRFNRQSLEELIELAHNLAK